jgi:hypothetical protein
MAAAAVAASSPIAGTWTATLHDLPAIKMTVEDSGGKLRGSIIFYFLMQENGVWKVAGDAEPTAMMNPRLEGKTFSFEVPHAKKHGSTDPADQEIITMHFHLTGANEGVFRNGKNGPELKLTRH